MSCALTKHRPLKQAAHLVPGLQHYSPRGGRLMRVDGLGGSGSEAAWKACQEGAGSGAQHRQEGSCFWETSTAHRPRDAPLIIPWLPMRSGGTEGASEAPCTLGDHLILACLEAHSSGTVRECLCSPNALHFPLLSRDLRSKQTVHAGGSVLHSSWFGRINTSPPQSACFLCSFLPCHNWPIYLCCSSSPVLTAPGGLKNRPRGRKAELCYTQRAGYATLSANKAATALGNRPGGGDGDGSTV